MSGPAELTHVDASGAARMVDVSAKDVTVREARAAGRFVNERTRRKPMIVPVVMEA